MLGLHVCAATTPGWVFTHSYSVSVHQLKSVDTLLPLVSSLPIAAGADVYSPSYVELHAACILDSQNHGDKVKQGS